MKQLDQTTLLGKLCLSHQLVFTYGYMVGTEWRKGNLNLRAVVPYGWFAAQALWKDCEEHWKNG